MAHPDLDTLVNALIPLAQRNLRKRGEFLPFGATIKSDGEFAFAFGYTGSEMATAEEVIELLERGFIQAARLGEVRATGLCIDSRVVPPGRDKKCDAICCSLDHENGEACCVFMPYGKGRSGKYKFGEIFALPVEPEIFAKSGSDQPDP